MVTATQTMLVQESFAAIVPFADEVAELFYQRLFDIEPSLERMFRGDMADQCRKLMQMLNAVVAGLDRLDQLIPMIQSLGRRHAIYGVTDAHYETVSLALLWTLEQMLGRDFTIEMKEAWATVYHVLATTMKTAAREVQAPEVDRST
jgi:hemoglobin-like flavoprotein